MTQPRLDSLMMLFIEQEKTTHTVINIGIVIDEFNTMNNINIKRRIMLYKIILNIIRIKLIIVVFIFIL